MPGTWGSAGGLVLVWILAPLPVASFLVFLLLVLITLLLLNQFLMMSPELQKDPQFVVMDEVLGIFVTFLGHPLTGGTVLIGFLAFRFFDAVKPLGIRRLEKVEGAWGIVLDDLAAGFFAHLVLHGYQWLGRSFA